MAEFRLTIGATSVTRTVANDRLAAYETELLAMREVEAPTELAARMQVFLDEMLGFVKDELDSHHVRVKAEQDARAEWLQRLANGWGE